MLTRYIRTKEVARLVGMHRATIARLVARGEFPAPVRVTPWIVVWPETTIVDWQAEMERRRSMGARDHDATAVRPDGSSVAAGEARS